MTLPDEAKDLPEPALKEPLRTQRRALRRRTLKEVQADREEAQTLDEFRPKVRGDCSEAARPCIWEACKHHLRTDVSQKSGTLRRHSEQAETCSLDVADRGGLTLEEVGGVMDLTRERVRQVLVVALLKLRLAIEPPIPHQPRCRVAGCRGGRGLNLQPARAVGYLPLCYLHVREFERSAELLQTPHERGTVLEALDAWTARLARVEVATRTPEGEP